MSGDNLSICPAVNLESEQVKTATSIGVVRPAAASKVQQQEIAKEEEQAEKVPIAYHTINGRVLEH
jgi:hypothetical protein